MFLPKVEAPGFSPAKENDPAWRASALGYDTRAKARRIGQHGSPG